MFRCGFVTAELRNLFSNINLLNFVDINLNKNVTDKFLNWFSVNMLQISFFKTLSLNKIPKLNCCEPKKVTSAVFILGNNYGTVLSSLGTTGPFVFDTNKTGSI